MRSALLILGLASTALAEPPRVGAVAPEFSLPAADGGKATSLKGALGQKGAKGALLLFIATRCPYSNAYNERMAALGKEYAAKGVAVVGINSNRTEPATDVAEHAKRNGFTFPVLKDDGAKVADLYGAAKTPEVFLVDAKGKVVYHGRIDENHEDAKAVKSPDLRNAVEALVAGKPVAVAETKAFGCSIKR